MKIHEYQAKEILRKYNVPVPNGILITKKSEAAEAAKKLGTDVVVVKAQIHAGGRGKGGGVKLAKNPQEAEKHADNILGMTLVTPQTGPEGRRGRHVHNQRVVYGHSGRPANQPGSHHGQRSRRNGD